MADVRRAAVGPGRSASSRRGSSAPSAGMPSVEGGAAGRRIAALEARLERLETTTGLRERGRNLMGKVAPPEASQHFRNAGREQLLGIRAIVDFWIRRIELADQQADPSPASRETIHID
ncbi:MAG: hypothetical protein ACRDGI_08815 [Candidatus Limnocylindrales bacterium]